MGTLQPGLPSPVMLPEGWDLVVIDLKDCFFTIPLHPEDAERFAFTVPSINKAEPAKRYHWVVLPQGMKNSPMICQSFVAWALEPIQKQYPHLLIYHYMDDILVAGKQLDCETILGQLTCSLKERGLEIAPEKIQKQGPWLYLGWIITNAMIRPQKVKINTKIETLSDAQRLIGDIQWVRNICGITNDDLKPLMPLLGTSVQAQERRQLDEDQQQALQVISNKIMTTYTHRRLDDKALSFMIVNSGGKREHPLGLIIQLSETKPNLRILEWIFLPFQPRNTVVTRPELFSQLVIKGRQRILDISGIEPEVIYIPVSQFYLDWLLSASTVFQIAIADFLGTITNSYPSDKLLSLLCHQRFVHLPLRSEVPVEGITVFTDAGRKSRKAAVTWKEGDTWEHQLLPGVPGDSLQTLELRAVIWTFQRWSQEPLNIVSDSLYVVGTVQRLENSMVKPVRNPVLHTLLLQLLTLLNQRQDEYFIMHIRSHQQCGGLALGNARADQLVAPAWTGPAVNTFEQARLSHQFFHQSAKMLARQFHIPVADARGIVQSCPDCQKVGVGLGLGVNPRGLQPLQLWQMDVTHIPEFGRLKYVHVSIDTFSLALWATAQTGETARHVIKHMHAAIMALGVPAEIKTDNGPAYTSRKFTHFCQLWGIRHITGIPHSPTGQAIVERAHQTLKALLQKQKGGEVLAAAERLAKAVYVLNFLRFTGDRNEPPVIIHSLGLKSGTNQCDSNVFVQYRDVVTGE